MERKPLKVFMEGKIFNHKRYKYVAHYFHKGNAESAKVRLKKKGHLVRITTIKGVYHLWARPKK